MSLVRIIGLTSIRVGEVGATGAMTTTLETISAIVPDSAHLVFEAPSVTDLYVEDEDLPDIQILGTSKKTMEFATRDMGGGIFQRAFGGGYDATTGVWSASTTGAVEGKELAIEAISKTYNGKKVKIEIPRTLVHPGADLRFTKTESGQITFACDVLMPASSTKISPIVVTPV